MDIHQKLTLPVELEKSLQQSLYQEGKTLVEYQISPGCKSGENFVAEIVHLILYSKKANQSHTENYVVKLPPYDKGFREGYKTHKFFVNEEAFYSKVLPELNLFLKQTTKNDVTQLSLPQCLYSCSDGENDALVLEDLCAQGFEMAKKENSLNVDEILLAFKELGRFHAVSLAMKELQPEKLDQTKIHLKETIFFEGGREQFKNSSACKAAIRMLESRYPERVEYLEKLQNFSGSFFDNMMKMVQTPTPLAVICHGGSWLKNIFFQYDQQAKPVKSRIFDFKSSRFGSLALDLSTFLYTSCKKEDLDEHWSSFLNTYVLAVNEALYAMGAYKSAITRNQIDEEMMKFGRFGLALAVQALPLITSTQMPKFEGDLTKYREYQQILHKDLKVRDRVTDAIVHACGNEIL